MSNKSAADEALDALTWLSKNPEHITESRIVHIIDTLRAALAFERHVGDTRSGGGSRASEPEAATR